MFVSPPEVAILTALDVAALVISNSLTADVSVCKRIISLPLASAIKPPSTNLGASRVLLLKDCMLCLVTTVLSIANVTVLLVAVLEIPFPPANVNVSASVMAVVPVSPAISTSTARTCASI